MIPFPTRNTTGNIFDVILMSNTNLITEVTKLPPIGISNYCVITSKLRIYKISKETIKHTTTETLKLWMSMQSQTLNYFWNC